MAKYRILAADKIAEEGLAFIRSQPDAELIHRPGINEEDLAKIVGEADGLIVRSGVKVTAKVLENPGSLKAIARAGVGVDNIDLDAATAKGIVVMNTAEANTLSTAEHAFALMLGVARQLGPAYQKMREGGWDRGKFMGRQLAGKTLGVVGFGRIGQALAKRALAFDMTVIAYDPFINAATLLDGQVKMHRDFEALLPHADVLSFHVPLNEQTTGMMGAAQFGRARKGVIVVNAARGGVIDEAALVEALKSGQCGGAGLDVFTTEPPAAESPLRSAPNLLTTPHLGASTHEAQLAVSVAAAEQLLAFFRGEGIRGAVNAGNLRVDLTPLQQRFVDLARRMAMVINPMITRGLAEVTLEVTGKDAVSAAGTIERAALVALLASHLTENVNLINVASVAQSRGITLRCITSEETRGPARLTLTIAGPADAVDPQTHPKDRVRRIVGEVHDDLRPRITEINGYFMDMIPAGDMALILNQDRPGMIGLVGTELGRAGVNIADMAISRRDTTALMLLKIDEPLPEPVAQHLLSQPGILKIARVRLPAE